MDSNVDRVSKESRETGREKVFWGGSDDICQSY